MRVVIRRGKIQETHEQRMRREEADAVWAKMEEDARKLEATLAPASSAGSLIFSPEQSAIFRDALLQANLASSTFLAAIRGVEPNRHEVSAYNNPCIDIAIGIDRAAGRDSTAIEVRHWSEGPDPRDVSVAYQAPTLILPSVERPEWPQTVIGRFMSRMSQYFPPRLVGMVPLVAQEAAEQDKTRAEAATRQAELEASKPQEVSLSTESLSFTLDPSLPELDTSTYYDLREFVQEMIARDLRSIIGGG